MVSFVVEDGERLSNAEIMPWLKTCRRALPQSPQAGEVVSFGVEDGKPLGMTWFVAQTKAQPEMLVFSIAVAAGRRGGECCGGGRQARRIWGGGAGAGALLRRPHHRYRLSACVHLFALFRFSAKCFAHVSEHAVWWRVACVGACLPTLPVHCKRAGDKKFA